MKKTYAVLGGGGSFGLHTSKYLLDHANPAKLIAVGRNLPKDECFTLGIGDGDWLHNIHGPVPEGHYTVPLGEPRLVTEGGDVTIVAASYATLESIKAARELEREGIKAEVIDLRTLVPRNDAAILASVHKTGRLVVVDQGTLTGGFAGEIVARVTEQAFGSLKAAPIRVTLPDIPTPTTRALSNYYYPPPRHIVAAVHRTLGMSSDDARDDPWAGIEPGDKTLDVPDKSFTGPF